MATKMTWTNLEQNSHDTNKLLSKSSNGFWFQTRPSFNNFITNNDDNHEDNRYESDDSIDWNPIFGLQNELSWTQVSKINLHIKLIFS